jgi:hypothetical protein
MPNNKSEISPLNNSGNIDEQKKYLIASQFGKLIITDNVGDKDIN